MINVVFIIFIVLGVLLSLVLLIELINGIYKRVKMKQQEKEWKEENIRNTFEEIRHRLDCHSETIGQMNWKLNSMEEVKLNEKKSNRTKRNK